MKLVKEVCVESFHEAVLAELAGATRIELCENLSCGGTTPSYGTIKKTIEKLQVPVMVMIRPRGGDFCYSHDEFEIMREDIRMCNLLGAAGVVFGLLERDNKIDIERTSELVELANQMPVTFHKAIDDSRDLLQSVTQLKMIGVSRILTSGGQPTAIEGADKLLRMIEIAGTEMNIIVAGKVTWENFDEIKRLIPSTEYHGRRLVKF
ncbi:MAG TPA: copper homeostasis protein CutC [Prolixibacteraceae bacterium]|jgi:copper homeostasis protein